MDNLTRQIANFAADLFGTRGGNTMKDTDEDEIFVCRKNGVAFGRIKNKQQYGGAMIRRLPLRLPAIPII